MRLVDVFENTHIKISEDGGVGRVVPGVNTTADVGPNEIKKQAKKFGFKVDKDGRPPLIREDEINELVPYKSHPVYKKAKKEFKTKQDYFKRQESLENFARSLKRHGFKLLGQGSFGITFEKPGYPWVIKVFTSDNPYKHFLDYVIAHQDNPHLPKIKGKFIKINDITFAVRIEKLKSVKYDNPVVMALDKIIGDPSDEGINKSLRDWLRKKYPRMLEVLKDLRKSTKKMEFNWDTHDENVMQRADGTIVITDPLYDPSMHR